MLGQTRMVAFQDSDTGSLIRDHFDGNLHVFNHRRLQAKTKVQTDVLDELRYADDMDNNAISEAKMQIAMDQVSQYHHTISTKKWLYMYTNQHLKNRTMNQLSL